MAEAKENPVIVQPEHENTLTFEDKVIKKIAGMAAGNIPGIFAMGGWMSGLTDKLRSTDDPTKGISVEVGKTQVAIDMKVICEFGRKMPETFQSVVDQVGSMVKDMTGLDVVEVNVHVADVLTPDEFEKQNRRSRAALEAIEEAEIAEEIDLHPDTEAMQAALSRVE